MNPIIAIIPSFDFSSNTYSVPSSYTKILSSLGAFTVIVPYETAFISLLPMIDAILLIGGCDPNPLFWGESPHKTLGKVNPNRDKYEINVVKTAFKNDIPLFGICRGAQIMNVALGGTLFQDISLAPSDLKHMQSAPTSFPTHGIFLNLPSLLYTLWQKYYNEVNSFHHQAIDLVPPPLSVCAKSPDGLTEAIECCEKTFFLGVQWHPELMSEDENQRKLFCAFVSAANSKKSKEE